MCLLSTPTIYVSYYEQPRPTPTAVTAAALDGKTHKAVAGFVYRENRDYASMLVFVVYQLALWIVSTSPSL